MRLRVVTAWFLVLAGAGLGLGLLVNGLFGGPEVGTGQEETIAYDPARFGRLPSFTDVTEAWRLDAFVHTGTIPASGGAAMGDLDGDGLRDLVVGGGSLAIFHARARGGFTLTPALPALADRDVTSVGAFDVDDDGADDVLVGTADGADLILWGPIRADGILDAVTELPGGEATTGLVAAELTGDNRIDVVRAGYGSAAAPAADVIHVQTRPRSFIQQPLPDGDRLSMAVEVADVDLDSLLDIWVVRDLGWRHGADSLYSRRGDPEGAWEDIAPALGADRAIDAMGVTVADLDGDGVLDGYVSDIGENDVLTGRVGGFDARSASGFGRIRAPGAPNDTVSSSWATGVADLNLDGRLDLVVTNGGATPPLENKITGTTIALNDTPSIYLGDGAGRFADIWPTIKDVDARGAWRGLSLGDLDGDGDTDVVLVEHGGRLVALRNDTPGTSLILHDAPACAASGVRVRIDVAGRVVDTLLGAHAAFGQHAREVIVGTMSARSADITTTVPGAELNPDVPLTGDRHFISTCDGA